MATWKNLLTCKISGIMSNQMQSNKVRKWYNLSLAIRQWLSVNFYLKHENIKTHKH